MPAPTRPRRPAPWALYAALPALLGLSGCGGDPGSNLERRAQTDGPTKGADPAVDSAAAEAPTAAPATAAPAADGAAAEAPTAAPAPGPDGLLSPGSGETIQLRLALPEGATYRVTTVGMAQFPMMPKPTGFAREESLALRGCQGEGSARTCAVDHAITNFDAEPPYGKFIAGDERPFRELTTTQTIRATGARVGEAAVGGPPEALGTDAARAAAELHPFFCIEFPDEPVGVGARWQVSCVGRSDARISRRTITWELTGVTDDPADGKRAELREVGSYTIEDPRGNRSGQIAGTLYFFVDAGAPHVLREAMATDIIASQGVRTQTSYNLQFALVDPKDPKKTTRTDGKPFPASAAPSGEAGDATSTPKPTPRPKPKAPPPPT